MRGFQSQWQHWGEESPVQVTDRTDRRVYESSQMPRVGTDKTDKRASVSFVSSLNPGFRTKQDSFENAELLPPEGDPRRVLVELIDAVWEAGAWLLISGNRVKAVPRDNGEASLTPELLRAVEAHQAGLLRVLQRTPR